MLVMRERMFIEKTFYIVCTNCGICGIFESSFEDACKSWNEGKRL